MKIVKVTTQEKISKINKDSDNTRLKETIKDLDKKETRGTKIDKYA